MSFRIILFFLATLFVFNCGQEKPKQAEAKSKTGVAEFKKGKVKIDGDASEWADNGVVISEVGLASDGGMGGFDIKTLQVGFDDANLYFLLTMNRGVGEYYAEKQAGGIIGDIYLDTDGDSTTGSIQNNDLYGFPPLNGYEVKIWIPAGVMENEKETKPLVSYKVQPLKEDKKKFESFKKIAEANCIDNPESIQFKDKMVEFAVPFQTLGIKPGMEIRGVISEYANSFGAGGASAFSAKIK